jgi:hypothetical protein
VLFGREVQGVGDICMVIWQGGSVASRWWGYWDAAEHFWQQFALPTTAGWPLCTKCRTTVDCRAVGFSFGGRHLWIHYPWVYLSIGLKLCRTTNMLASSRHVLKLHCTMLDWLLVGAKLLEVLEGLAMP